MSFKIKKCPGCRNYTLSDFCKKCKSKKTAQAGYKFREYKKNI